MVKTKQGRVPPEIVARVMRELGRRGGLASAARLTPEQLRERARKGGLARAQARKEAVHA